LRYSQTFLRTKLPQVENPGSGGGHGEARTPTLAKAGFGVIIQLKMNWLDGDK
jgi:hypothetical protein